jgi:hypothetical protein
MNLLLDTHIFLWFVNDDPRLSDRLKDLIEDESNFSYLLKILRNICNEFIVGYAYISLVY